MAKGIVIDYQDVLTDESDNDKAAISLIRQLVASSGLRVPEQSIQNAESFAIESFAPNFYEAMIFWLVDRNPEVALRVSSAFKKQFRRQVRIRQQAADLLQACKHHGWRVALASTPTEEEAQAMHNAGIWGWIDVKGTPPGTKIRLPDLRVLEFLAGRIGGKPRDCVLLGNRLDINIRPGNLLRMTTVLVQTGKHGQRQQPRDLKDVPTYVAGDMDELIGAIPQVV
jgi:putative hydrolase of the HAD superfamily